METNKTALLVMDMQTGILNSYPDVKNAIVGNVQKAIAHARSSNMPVFYVVVGFRPGMPEVNPNNKSFSAVKERMKDQDMAAFAQVDASVAPAANDVVIVKKRVSAFTGSDLEVLLRSHGIQHLVLTGVATSGVVLSTLREAADKDYKLTVLADCCGDPDPEVQKVLTTKIFNRQAEVMNVAEWAK